ncbi:DNA topoisomerase 2 [Gryllus bimaculatus]|nr:DNA topoisomerase 2 [Gryllus bimaculatus]
MIENNIPNGNVKGAGDSATQGSKKLTIEKIYQKKSQLEHILLRPDTYIGSVEPVKEEQFIYDEEKQQMIKKEITYVPGLYKIFDEILVNAADNKQRDPSMSQIRIDIDVNKLHTNITCESFFLFCFVDREKNVITIFNNGQGIPVVKHKEEKMYVPTMIFGHLLTSSNYNDEEQKVTGGRNGYGAKLCNIFSTKFTVETASSEYSRAFKQTWENNMSIAKPEKIQDYIGKDYTKISFSPDLSKFKMEKLDQDIVDLMTRRAFDVAASTAVNVFLNNKKLSVHSFKEYVNLFIPKDLDNPPKVVYEKVNDRWEVAVTVSEGFQQMSFVNSIATTKGGRHVDHVTEQIVKNILDKANKKHKGSGIKQFQVKNHLWVFLNCLIINPTFDSQTKENMTTMIKNFGSKCQLSEAFFKNLNVKKLEDANHAGSKYSMDCTLILTEGDSAKTLAVAGLGVVGRDKYGVYPLRGKLLNVREASSKQILENKEITEVVKILGLQYKRKYENMDDLKTLRYGKLMIMTDQDQDGSHIKGLIINFIHHNWPSLLKLPFLEEFITPIVKATKNKEQLSFFSLPEFEEWKKETNNWHTYKIKYYKGLGTSTSKEAQEYFSDMQRHRIRFKYSGPNDDTNITMVISAFSKKCVEQRKEWLTQWMESVKQRREMGLPEDYLYEKNTSFVNYSDFVNKELVLFSNSDNERSIPNVMDGMKPGQRKVLFTCFKRKDPEIKVAQLAGSVAEKSAYHHGEVSLMGTIVNLAQNFVGSNNINLLLPIGQFGTRLQGGKDQASPRYIFTALSPLAKYIFHPDDEPLLTPQYDDNLKIEPVYYVPIIPMVLVNGAEGIGTGWSTKIPNFNPYVIIKNIQKMLNGEEPDSMIPWYKNFRGTIEPYGGSRYATFGELATLSENTVEISELPVGVWTENYKNNVLDVMCGDGKTPGVITGYNDYNTDTTVRFVVQLPPEKLVKAEDEGLHKFFKLQNTMSTASMVAFDSDCCLRRYDTAAEILKEHFRVRLEYYVKRKAYLEGKLQAESRKLSNQARFIMEKCNGQLTIENKKRIVMVQELQKKGYDPDPIRAWNLLQDKEGTLAEESQSLGTAEEDSEAEESEAESKRKFDYLLGMQMWSLTLERKNQLLKQRDERLQEYEHLRKKSPESMWREDLDALLAKLKEVEEEEKKSAEMVPSKGKKAGGGKGPRSLPLETKPSAHGSRVAPKFDNEMLKKLEKIDKPKGKRVKKADASATAEDQDEFDDLIDKPTKSLKDRLGNSPEEIEKKLQAKRKTSKVKYHFSDESEAEWNDDDDSAPVSKSSATAPAKPSAPVEDKTEESIVISGTDSEFEPESTEPRNSGGSDAMFDSLLAAENTDIVEKAKPANDPSSKKKAPAKKAPAVKKPAAKRPKKKDDSDSDEFSEKFSKKGRKKADSDDDFDIGSVEPKPSSGRKRTAAKYIIDSDDDFDDFD